MSKKKIDKKISTPKQRLAEQLSKFSWKERRQVLSAARHLRKYTKLIEEQKSRDEELEAETKALESEK